MSYRGAMWGAAPKDIVEQLGKRSSSFIIGGKCYCEIGHECPPNKMFDEPPAQRHCFSEITVGGVRLEETWTFMVDHLAGIVLSFDSDDYSTMRGMFVERYGPPTTTEHTPFKTRGGLETTNEELTWDGSLVRVKLEQYSGKITEGQATVMTKTLLNELAKAGKQRQAEGAKVF